MSKTCHRPVNCLLLMALILSCSAPGKYNNRYSLVADEKIKKLALGKESSNFLFHYQYVNLGDNEYFAVTNVKQNRIEVYDFKAENLFKEIQFYNEGPESFGFLTTSFMEDTNSFIVNCGWRRTIGFSDGSGHVTKELYYGEDVNGRAFQPSSQWLNLRPIKAGETVNFAQQYNIQAENTGGILTAPLQKESYVNVALDLVSGECVTSPLTYPEEVIGKDIINGYTMIRTLGKDDCFVYLFNMEYLFVTCDHQSFRKIPLEVSYKMKFNNDNARYLYDLKGSITNTLRYDSFLDMMYDNYRDCYYLIIQKRDDNLDVDSDIFLLSKYCDCLILILNSNFSYLGEVFLPGNTYSYKTTFVTPEGLYISEDHPNNPDFDEDFMRFRLFRLEKL